MLLFEFLKLIRPHQYIKNVFIFAPLFFALKITEVESLFSVCVAFIAFSLVASAVYIFNDYQDISYDKSHYRKKNRPLAKGSVSKRQAIGVMLLLLSLGMVLMAMQSYGAFMVLMGYVLINVAYSLGLKCVAILDVMIISVGFVCRLFVGSIVGGVMLSQWIVIITFLLAFFLSIAKRRDDVLIFIETGKKMRRVVDGYSVQFVDVVMSIMTAIVIMSYIMYVTSQDVILRVGNEYLYLTSFFVIIGMMRYLQVVLVEEESGSPTSIILKDRFIQVSIVGWFLFFIGILY